MSEDYYEILGVDEDATREEIRSAYRRRAKECHPDCAEVSSEPFRRVHEAYEVLSDPARRRVYDREQGSEYSVPVRRGAQAEPLRPTRSSVEPLTSRPHAYGRPPSFFDEFFPSPFDSILDDLWGGFGSGATIPASPHELEMDVYLSAAQAREGGTFRAQIAVRALCPACYGEGWTGPYRCGHCDGTGTTVVERPLTVSYPAGIGDGEVGRMSLRGNGLPGSDLVVHFHVRAW